MQRFSSYLAKALPLNFIKETEIYVQEDRYNKGLISSLEINNKNLEKRLGTREIELDEFKRKTRDYEQEVDNLKGSLGEANVRIGELNVSNESLRNEVEVQKDVEQRLLDNARKKETKYRGFIKNARYFLGLARKRATALEENFYVELEEIEKRQGMEYRRDLEGYFESSEGVIKKYEARADDAEKQQVFLRGALTRLLL